MTTRPGFSSRSTSTSLQQFPMRDEDPMTEMTPGWSNSTASEPAKAEAEEKVVEPAAVEDKAVKAPARKAAPRKRAS